MVRFSSNSKYIVRFSSMTGRSKYIVLTVGSSRWIV